MRSNSSGEPKVTAAKSVTPASASSASCSPTCCSSPISADVGDGGLALAVEDRSVGGEVVVQGEELRRPSTSVGGGVGDAHGERGTDAWRRTAGQLGRGADGRGGVVTHVLRPGPTEQRSPGLGTGQLQHLRAHGRKEDRDVMRVADRELSGGPQDLALEVHRLAGQHREEDRQVLTHVPGRRVERQPEHPLDEELVRQPDAERQPTTREHRRSQGLLGEHHGMPRVHRHDVGPQLDPLRVPTDRGERGQRLEREDVRQPERVQLGLLRPLRGGQRLGERDRPGHTDKETHSHLQPPTSVDKRERQPHSLATAV